jgi:hypothetical protein
MIIIKAIIHFFKVRYHAKPFDVYNECECRNRHSDGLLSADWISYDGKLYYGHPFFIFFESAQNSWWLIKDKL